MEMLVPKWELPIANAKDFCGSGNHMVVGRGMLLTLIGEAIGIGVTAQSLPTGGQSRKPTHHGCGSCWFGNRGFCGV